MRIVSGDPRMAVDQIPGGGYSIRLIQDERITAKITGKFTLGSATFYQWSEVRPKLDGSGYETLTGGRTGDNTAAYAAELNGSSSVPNDTIVVLRPRVIADTSSLSGSGQVVALLEFEFTGTTATTTTPSIFSLDFITAISCVDGVITPQYSTVCIPGGYVCTTTTTTTAAPTTTTTTTTTTMGP